MTAIKETQRTSPPPRLLTRKAAAAYCSVSIPTFGRVCAVAPIALGKGCARLHRFDIKDIDAWIDGQKNLNDNSAPSKAELLGKLLS